MKRTKSKFWELVKCCLDNTGVLNIKRMRLCSKKARQYMLLYKAVEAIEITSNSTDSPTDFSICKNQNKLFMLNKHSIMEDTLKLYRRLQKKRYTHRTVMVSDLRSLEAEFSMEDNTTDSKKHLINCLVNKMLTL